MKKYLYLLAPDSPPGTPPAPPVNREDRITSIRKKLERMNNTELEKFLHEATEAVRENPEDEDAQAALAMIEDVLLKPKQTIKARAKNAVMIDGKPIAKDQVVMLTPQQFGAHAVNLAKVAAALALVAFLSFFATTAKAQQQYDNAYLSVTNGSSVLLNGGTNSIAAGGTNILNDVITVTKWGDIDLFFSSAAMAASTSNTVWQIDKGPDGTNWAPCATITYAQTGTTPVGVETNLNVGSAGYIRVTQESSPTSLVPQTNVIAKRIFKPSRFGN